MLDVIVIGVGTFGAAACDCLARRGVRVLGLEQFTIPHNRGSHHGKSRMFRMAYYEHPNYVPLLMRAYDGWKELEDRAGVSLFHEVGALYMGRPQSELMAGSLQSARRHGLAPRLLTHADLATEFPQFHLPDDHIGLLESRAGYVLPELAVETMAHQAAARGAQILHDQRVVAWKAAEGYVEVQTATALHRAQSLIITVGAWAPMVVKDLGVRLTPTRQVMGWVRPVDISPFRGRDGGGGFPCWGAENDDGSLHYGFPVTEGEDSLKLALHARGADADPDHLDKMVTPEDERTFRSVLDSVLPGAVGPTVRTCVCMYTNSPDSHFIIDRHPTHDNVIVACGFSGHGFKFAPVIGEVLADLTVAGRTDWPVEFLSLRRFTT
jgi:sarcosine oxidase